MQKEKGNVEKLLKRIEESSGLEKNKQLIKDYYYEGHLSGTKPATWRHYLLILYRLLEFVDKPFDELTKTDLIDFFMNLKPMSISVFGKDGKQYVTSKKEYSDFTLSCFKVNIKVFYKWLFKGNTKIARDEKGSPLMVSWIKGSRSKLKEKYQKKPLTREEVQRLIQAVRGTRTKAMLAVLFDSGQRQDEFLNMRLSKILFADDYCEFECDGKTGKRQVILIKSYPYLKAWLKEREYLNVPKGDADYVWITTTKSFKNTVPRRMRPGAMWAAVKYAAKKAGINKRVWVHGLRHSSVTDFFKQGYNEAEARLKYGWSPTSNTPSIYNHYKEDELKRKQLIRNGLAQDNNEFDENILQIRECPFCSKENPIDHEYCYSCGKPMHVQKIKEESQKGMAFDAIQETISQLKNLEAKGFNMQQFNEFMQQFVEEKTKDKKTTAQETVLEAYQ